MAAPEHRDEADHERADDVDGEDGHRNVAGVIPDERNADARGAA